MIDHREKLLLTPKVVVSVSAPTQTGGVVLDLGADRSAIAAPGVCHAMSAIETLGLDREAEDEFLALLARGIREAAESRAMPILRVIREVDDMSDDSHRRVSRRDGQHGDARCHSCRRAVDIKADGAHLHSMHGPPGDDVVVLECPRCRKTTPFHVEGSS